MPNPSEVITMIRELALALGEEGEKEDNAEKLLTSATLNAYTIILGRQDMNAIQEATSEMIRIAQGVAKEMMNTGIEQHIKTVGNSTALH